MTTFRQAVAWIFLVAYLLTSQMGQNGFVLCRAEGGHLAVEAAGHQIDAGAATARLADDHALKLSAALPQNCIDTPLLESARGETHQTIAVAPAVSTIVRTTPPIGPPTAKTVPLHYTSDIAHPTLVHRRTVVLLI